MKFKKLPPEQAVPEIAQTINQALQTKSHVLWLVCGGSNIATQVEIMKLINSNDSARLTILPMDERYGESGHNDSNYHQMKEAGFNPKNANWVDILERNQPLAETVSYYSELVGQAFADASYVIGTFGMGADGHTAGVLPDSPAVTDTISTVVGYEAPGFTRMTIAPQWLIRCDVSYVLTYGQVKKTALSNLKSRSLTIEKMPAVLHHDIANTTVYNDFIDDNAAIGGV